MNILCLSCKKKEIHVSKSAISLRGSCKMYVFLSFRFKVIFSPAPSSLVHCSNRSSFLLIMVQNKHIVSFLLLQGREWSDTNDIVPYFSVTASSCTFRCSRNHITVRTESRAIWILRICRTNFLFAIVLHKFSTYIVVFFNIANHQSCNWQGQGT